MEGQSFISSSSYRNPSYTSNSDSSHKRKREGKKNGPSQVTIASFDDPRVIDQFLQLGPKQEHMAIPMISTPTSPNNPSSQLSKRRRIIDGTNLNLQFNDPLSEKIAHLQRLNSLTGKVMERNNPTKKEGWRSSYELGSEREQAERIYFNDKEGIRNHAKRRLLDLHLKHELHQGLEVRDLRMGATDLQIFKGEHDAGTEAAHASLHPNIIGNYLDAFTRRIVQATLDYNHHGQKIPSELHLQLSALGHSEEAIYKMFNEASEILQRECEEDLSSLRNYIENFLKPCFSSSTLHSLLTDQNKFYLTANNALKVPTLVNRIDDLVEFSTRESALREIERGSFSDTPSESTYRTGKEILQTLVMNEFGIDADLKRLDSINKFLLGIDDLNKKLQESNWFDILQLLKFKKDVNQLQSTFERDRLYTSHRGPQKEYILDCLQDGAVQLIQNILNTVDLSEVEALTKNLMNLNLQKKELYEKLKEKQILVSDLNSVNRKIQETQSFISKIIEKEFGLSMKNFQGPTALSEYLLSLTPSPEDEIKLSNIFQQLQTLKKLQQYRKIIIRIKEECKKLRPVDDQLKREAGLLLTNLKYFYAENKNNLEFLIKELKKAKITLNSQADGTAELLGEFIPRIQPDSIDTLSTEKEKEREDEDEEEISSNQRAQSRQDDYDPRTLQAILMSRSLRPEYI